MLGQTLGSYSILERLGAGAMGEVYLGEHRHLKRKVAIKLLAKELMSRPELLERFFMEARATSVIAHPGIVQIFDCEVDGEGRPYIVMEYLPGETLGAELGRLKGPLPIPRATRLARGIAEALEAAHEKGIIHRDLKPDNVFVARGPTDSVKVVDFGIAKLVGELRAASMHQTHSGTIMGTPLYMSPEQCRGSANVDFRTDIYSLGCVFFEMLTGRPPFISEGMGELIVDHLRVPPPEVQRLNPEAPTAVASLVAQLLSKEPADRPASMREVAERLTTIQAPSATSWSAEARESLGGSKVSASTFGGSAAEVQERGDDMMLRPPRSAAPWVVGGSLLLLLGGGGAFRALRPVPTTDDGSKGTSVAAPAREPAQAVPATKIAAATGPAVSPASPVVHLSSASSSTSAASPSADASHLSARETTKVLPPARKQGHLVGSTDEPTARSPAVADFKPPAISEKAPIVAKEASEPALVPPSPEPRGLVFQGTWEGPWVDADAKQQGRLYLVVESDGRAAGWFNNKGANESFRVVGRVREQGQLDLDCQCPAAQMFVLRGSLRREDEGVSGGLALWSGGRAFGHPRVNLRRTSGRP